jgi:ferritin-like metal-binding protein YciE
MLMAGTKTLHDALVDELRDLYHAEKQLVRALPKMARAAGREELREALENHLAETEHQLTRLEQAFEHLEERARAKPCHGMAGIIEEGSELLKEDFPEAVMDAQIIAAAQRVEHYEISAYGTVAAWADQLGRGEVAELLRETLEEEKHADSLLTSLAESGLNAEATAGNGGGAGFDEDDEGSRSSSGRAQKQGAGRSGARSSKRGSARARR